MNNSNNERDDYDGFQFTDPNKEFTGKFILSPDIKDDADYSHIDKNSVLTYLKDSKDTGISEVEQLRALDYALHILTLPKYYSELNQRVLIGYNEEETKEGIVRTPVYEDKVIRVHKFPIILHLLKAKRYSFVTTASARMGFRYNKSKTQILEKSETLQDKTEVKKSWFGNNNNNQQRY